MCMLGTEPQSLNEWQVEPSLPFPKDGFYGAFLHLLPNLFSLIINTTTIFNIKLVFLIFIIKYVLRKSSLSL